MLVVSLLLAYLAMLSSIIIIYHGLFRFLKILYRYNPIWCISFAILVAPFAYVLVQSSDLLELIWILLLTPFYGLTVLSSVFTGWIIVYYNITFGALAALCSLSRLRHHERFLKNAVPLIILAIILMDVAAFSPEALAGDSSHSPTYKEALQFISSDQTNENIYLEGRYTCNNFATDFWNNAVSKGYVCGYVVIYFPSGQSHAIDCFNTTDNGLIFIEPQTDSVVKLIRNQPYWDGTKYEPQSYNDTVINYAIDWHTGSNGASYSRLLAILASIGFCPGLVQLFNYHVICSITKAITRRQGLEKTVSSPLSRKNSTR
jgi:hypothetical protein